MDGAAVIAAYHDLWRVEQLFRMTKGDLRARPVFHHQREAIEAHLTVVFAALAVARHLQDTAGTSIKIIQTPRTARSATIEISGQRLTFNPDLTVPDGRTVRPAAPATQQNSTRATADLHTGYQRHREPERPVPVRGPGPPPLPDRAGRPQVPLPGHPVPGPDRPGQGTMGDQVEADPERLRHRLRRPPRPQHHQLTDHGQLHRWLVGHSRPGQKTESPDSPGRFTLP
jgi:hypothetical protein